MNNQDTLTQFRTELYRILGGRADAAMDLIDALASNTVARTVVELRLSGLFRRGHGSVMAAIANVFRPSSPLAAAAE